MQVGPLASVTLQRLQRRQAQSSAFGQRPLTQSCPFTQHPQPRADRARLVGKHAERRLVLFSSVRTHAADCSKERNEPKTGPSGGWSRRGPCLTLTGVSFVKGGLTLQILRVVRLLLAVMLGPPTLLPPAVAAAQTPPPAPDYQRYITFHNDFDFPIYPVIQVPADLCNGGDD